MQLSDRPEILLAVGNIIILLIYIPLTSSQNLPSTDDDRFFPVTISPQGIFKDTRIIPDGNSVSAYLKKGKPENYFFRVEKNNLPLKITLTPCLAVIRWTIKRRELKPDTEDENDEELSDPDPEPFHAQRSVSRNPQSPYTILGNFSGSEALSFYHGRVRSGLYMINIESITKDTSLNLYGTTTPYSDHLMPTLPNDKSVSIISHSKRMFTFQWTRSDLDLGLNSSLEYCVAVNQVKNYKTHCAALSQFQGHRVPKPDDGWGFSWEKRERQRARQLPKPKKRRHRGKLFYKCIGSKTKYTYNKAKPGNTYFVDVFVLNRNVNVDAAYSGTNVKTDKRDKAKKGKDKYILKDGKGQTIKLHKGTSQQLVIFNAKSRFDSAVLELKSCRGKVPITIYHENTNIHQTVVRSIKVLRMKNLPAGQYTIKLAGNKNRKRVVSVFLTSSTYKKPKLPKDNRIHVNTSATLCNSVTLSWSITSIKQRYCLYMRESSILPTKRSHHCLEMSGRRKKDKVICVRLKRNGRDKSSVSQTVRKLKPNTNYVFDVYVNRGKSVSLAYQSVITRTKTSCRK